MRAALHTFIARQKHSAIVTPAGLAAGIYRILRKPAAFGPFSNAQSFTVDSQKDVVSAVPSLLCWSSPTNIAWLVMSVCIHTLHGMFFRRTATDYGKEMRVGFEKALDATPAIEIIISAFRVVASSQDSSIHSIFRRHCTTFGIAVNRVGVGFDNAIVA